VLRNESIGVDLRFGPVWFVGVDDGYSMRDDLEKAQSDLSPEQYPRILLTHYPDVVDRLRQDEFQLSLAGHSHGGQVRIPILDRLVVNGHARTSYTRGLFLVNGNPLYVNPGIGMSGLPLRFRNRPEVTFLRFTSGRCSPLRD
ncbi:MAG: metallophosphoesterase, partial [Chloroflexota bacterium]|jgi:predicted MPP superfamily phosphohydrolase